MSDTRISRERFDVFLQRWSEADTECMALSQQGVSTRSFAWKDAAAVRDKIADEFFAALMPEGSHG